MFTTFHFAPPVTLRLARGELLAWRQPRGARLRVLSGSAWVTRSNELDDHFLAPGQTLSLRRSAPALISAEQDAWMSFEADSVEPNAAAATVPG